MKILAGLVTLATVLGCAGQVTAVTVFLDYGTPGNTNDDFVTRLDELTIEAVVAPTTPEERAFLQSTIKTGLESAYSSHDVVFSETEPSSGAFETLKFGKKDSDVEYSVIGSGGMFEIDWLNTEANGTGYIFTANFLFGQSPPPVRSEMIGLLGGLLSHTSVHEVGHGFGLDHQDAYGDPAITPANYSDTHGVQNTHFMATGDSGLSVADFVGGTPFTLSPLSGAKLEFASGLTLAPAGSVPEIGASHGAHTSAQALSLAPLSISGLMAGNVHGAEISLVDEVDVYSFTARAGDLITANALSAMVYREPPLLDTVLSLFDTDGATLLDASDDTILGDDVFGPLFGTTLTRPDSFILNYVIPADGTYYLAVTSEEETTGNYDLFVAVTPVPEPATLFLAAFGLLGLPLYARRRKR